MGLQRLRRWFCVAWALGLGLAGAVWAGQASRPVPTFKDYPVRVEADAAKGGRPPKVILATAQARHYRSAIRSEAGEPANFAGHFRVITWGCGTDCHGFAILDRQTGVAYTPPGIDYVAGVMGNDEERVEHYLDSRLLVLNGQINDNEKLEAKHLYLWDGHQLKLLRRTHLFKEEIDTSCTTCGE